MRALVLSALVAIAGCSGRSLSLPPSDGYGPVGGVGTSPSGTATAPSAPPSSPMPPSPPPVVDAGTEEGGSAAVDSGAHEAGPDAGGHHDAGPGTDGGVATGLLALCVSQINQLRSQYGVQPYTESPDLEAFAAKAAASDAQSGQPDGYFNATGGGGIAATENEYDGAQIAPGGTAQQVLTQGIQGDEQNQTGGLGNLVTDQLSQVGCGFAKDAQGNWWVAVELQ